MIFTSLGTPIDKSRILARSLESGEQTVLLDGATFGRVTPSGHVYLRSYPGGETRHQVSTVGGMQAVWSRSGRELFYRSVSY